MNSNIALPPIKKPQPVLFEEKEKDKEKEIKEIKEIKELKELKESIKDIKELKENKENKINLLESGIYNTHDDFLILTNLSILNKIQNNDKLVVYKNNFNNDSNRKLIDFEIHIDNGYLRPITRWYQSQCRSETIDYINRLIDISIIQYNELKKKNNKIAMNKYASALENSKTGLNNLKITYADDRTIISKIDLIIEKIEVFRFNIHI